MFRRRATSLFLMLVAATALSTSSAKRSHHHNHHQHQLQERRRPYEKQTGHNPVRNTVHPTNSYSALNNRRNVLLHEAVRKMLGFESSPVPTRPKLLPDPRTPPPMPQYVLDLYEMYRSGQAMDQPNLANTVRSIPAEIGEVNGEAMFIFNLSSIASSEQLLRAHLHLYKRKPTHRKRRSRNRADTEMILYEVAPHYLSQTGAILMRSSARGWQWYGATDAVLSCLLVDRQRPHLFAVAFRAEKPNGRARTLRLKKFVRYHSLPFLILYSNETESVNLEELDIVAERLKQNARSEAQRSFRALRANNEGEIESVSDENEESNQNGKSDKILKAKKNHPKNLKGRTTIQHNKAVSRRRYNEKKTIKTKLADNEEYRNNKSLNSVDTNRSDQAQKYNDTVPILTQRSKRSILTNEIPQDSADFSKYYPYNLPLTHPGMLMPRTERRHEVKEIDIIPYPDERKQTKTKKQRNHGKRKNRRRKRKNKRRILGSNKLGKKQDTVAAKNTDPAKVCGRRRLVVDFEDIGWGDWIISPRSFEAHYCSGRCPFPLTKRLRPSNHATIQSIIHAVGLYSKVPAPCCVPDAMTSVTLLYFDENRNVVLKNYPGMSVQSCACR